MYLCLDIGNTSIGFAEVVDDKIVNVFRIRTVPFKTAKEYHDILKDNLLNKVDDVIISSVVPSINPIFKTLFNDFYNIDPMFVTNNLNTGINIKIDNPDELGADLLVDAVASYVHHEGNNMVVDLGTANKYLVILGHDFMGGAIAPGVVTSLKHLFNNAELLEDVTLEVPKKVVGTSTIECIRSGSVIGTAATIDGMVRRMEEEVGPLHVIITGGIADRIISEVKVEFEYVPNLIFDGLIQIYKLNH